MTAEIAVLNKNGIALAADSKVTIGAAGQEKTFDTVNKLFTLSKVHPIGVMIFGNAEFMRYPWETIVKLYRQQKGDRSEPTVEDWGADFLIYLSSFGDIRDTDKSQNIRNTISSVFEELQEDVFSEARQKEIAIPSKDYVQLLKARIDHEVSARREAEDYFDKDQSKAFVTKHAADLAQVLGEYIQPFDDKDLMTTASELALLAVFKRRFSPQSSGFVIAGFGNDEVFPALVPYETDGYLGNVLKVSKGPTTAISRDTSSSIRPFAQREMVHRFMEGMDPVLLTAMQRIFTATLTSACFDVLEKYGDPAKQTDANRDLIRDAAVAAIDTVGERLSNIQRINFSRPIMQMVSLLPKDELPNLAESLVALTSLKRHVSRDAETVGGPIDVCLISKGDGFIWIKRKHYFKPELNPQFTRNYMRGMIPRGEGDEGPGAQHPARATRKRSQKKAPAATTTAK